MPAEDSFRAGHPALLGIGSMAVSLPEDSLRGLESSTNEALQHVLC